MNRMVHDHYPIERLPEDLRRPFGPALTVRVVIEAEDLSEDDAAVNAAVADLLGRRTKLQPNAADAVARVRTLRDDWDR